ncbi:YdcF family protein [Tropicimonas aquimaris]|uniref:YdcF family protein n=1 Tax=Tropicimonas aquimaris TaxID=914152 RepID=A0ABW3ILB5_9RHOB
MDTVFFILSKLAWALLKPETWILIGVGLTCLAAWFGRLRAARLWSALTLGLVLAIGVIPIGGRMVMSLEQRYPANPPLGQVDGIIVLGGGERPPRFGQPQVGEGGERYIETLSLALRHPEARVIYVGGSGALKDALDAPRVHARSARLFFERTGLDPERLTFETASRNTAENAVLSLEMVQPQPGQSWVLVTSAFHMPRALRSFERAGWTGIVPWPADFRGRKGPPLDWDLTQNLDLLGVGLREYIGLFAYGVTGR